MYTHIVILLIKTKNHDSVFRMTRLPKIASFASFCFTALLVVHLPEAVYSKSKVATHDKGEITIDKKGKVMVINQEW